MSMEDPELSLDLVVGEDDFEESIPLRQLETTTESQQQNATRSRTSSSSNLITTTPSTLADTTRDRIRQHRAPPLVHEKEWTRLFFFFSLLSVTLIAILECTLGAIILSHYHQFNAPKRINLSQSKDLSVNFRFNEGNAFFKNATVSALALYLYAEFYQLVLSLFVIRSRNVYLLITYLLIFTIMCFYSAFQHYELVQLEIHISSWGDLIKSDYSLKQPSSLVQNLSRVIVIIFIVTLISQCTVVYKICSVFSRHTAQEVGNQFQLSFANSWFTLHRCLLLLCNFFTTGLLIILSFLLNQYTAEVNAIIDQLDWRCIILLPLSFWFFILADYAAAREKKTLLKFILIGDIVLIYFCFDTAVKVGKKTSWITPCLALFGAFALFLPILFFFVSVFFLYSQFGRGLYQIHESDYNWIFKDR
ncbi:unnamed protein product [Ambrosiozyma monospora]|uniref:Unnamed protein product n=1 Tax=Ambrosiozyma monospora TaxID=43982 RepID=A0A9W6YUB2_AMBMO|nr:unnamed protein product [Ambrosiozyma monospora]